MTTMPPEMSSAGSLVVGHAAPPGSLQRDSMSSLHASRSRFMITDILAGSAAAAAAAAVIRNGASPPGRGRSRSRSPPGRLGPLGAHPLHPLHHLPPQHLHHPQHQPHHQTPPPLQLTTAQQHHQQQQHQQQQHAALQHYLAQQQHLLQQHQQQQQQQHLYHGSPPPSGPPTPPAGAPPTPLHPHAHPQHPLALHPHPHPHAPHAQLPGFPGGGHGNGLHAVQAAQAAHYAALQQERERERLRELEAGAPESGPGQGPGPGPGAGLDHDERSRSPLPVRDLSSGGPNAATPAASAIGGGGSSISGDQASTIDDSDSDTCGAKDDDGNSSIKSDNLMGLSKKQRKARTAFTDHQLQTLEKSFERQKYLSVQDRMELANKLELSDCQVKTWYQNRRTKWKRQTAVGLELLAEAGNYAAFQRLYGGSPYLSAWPYAAAAAAQSPHGGPPSAIDLYYRQAAAAAALQKPLSYRMYPSVPAMGLPVGPTAHLSASNSLSSLSSYYQANAGPPQTQPPLGATNGGLGVGPPGLGGLVHRPGSAAGQSDDASDKQRRSAELQRTPSPQLNPGSPEPEPERADNNSSCPPPSDGDDEAADERRPPADGEDDDDDDAIEV